MTEQRIDAYEGLFLFPQTQAGDLRSALDHLEAILERAGAKIISLRKWDERRLAYDIRGHKRGVYILVYFRTARSSLTGIERACNLSELLLRSMIVRADLLTQEQMEAEDGRAELADEIKLRESQAQAADEASREKEPVTVETESAAKDAAATEA